MSRPKVVTIIATNLFRREAIRRIANRTNKQLARELAEQGVVLSPQYIGQLIAEEIRFLRAKSFRAQKTPRGSEIT